jgi:hypothetical protein
LATATYDLIASQTLGTAAASITFSSIAASWTDLRLVYSGVSAATNTLHIKFNGSSSSYSLTELYGNGSSNASTSYQNSTNGIYPNYSGALRASYPFMITMDVFSYAGSTYKTALCTAVEDYNGAYIGYVEYTVGLWRNTSAITSLTIDATVNLSAGTTAQLYGIKAA